MTTSSRHRVLKKRAMIVAKINRHKALVDAYSSPLETASLMSITLTMAIQLAVVFIVPIVLGHLLDNYYNSLPLYTMIGFGLAIIGMIFVVKHTLNTLNLFMEHHLPASRKKKIL